MEEESPQLFELYDFFWFRHHVLLGSPFPAVSIPEPEVVSAHAEATGGSRTGATQVPPGQKSAALRRTLGDEVTLATSSDSALLAPRRPVKLHTILSGKEASDEELEEEEHREACGRRGCSSAEQLDEIRDWGQRERKRSHSSRHRERRRAASQGGQSKSLSELEFEELKGFMDLGFTFPEAAESDQRLLSIVPGLRRRASSEEEGMAKEAEDKVVDGAADPAVARRPYLSEAWKYLAADHYQEEGRSSSGSSSAHDHLLRNWRVPATGDGVDMKGHLRSWAHTVASAVR